MENSIVLNLKVACFLKCKEKGKLINIQTLKSKKELVLLLRCFHIEVKLLQTTPQAASIVCL